MLNYPVHLEEQAEGGYVVTFPDVPEAITQGDDREEALMYAVDALETALSFYVDARQPLPTPSKPKRNQPVVSPTALEGAKLGLYQIMTTQGLRKSDLSKRLGWHLPQVDRLFDMRHASKIDQIEMAAKAMGKRLEVTFA